MTGILDPNPIDLESYRTLRAPDSPAPAARPPFPGPRKTVRILPESAPAPAPHAARRSPRSPRGVDNFSRSVLPLPTFDPVSFVPLE